MNPPDWVTDEASWRKTCRLVAARCNDYLEGRIGLIEVSRELSGYAFRLRSEQDPDFLFFRAVDSETDHLPVGKYREGWAADSLAKKDQEVRDSEAFYREGAIEAATRLFHKYRTDTMFEVLYQLPRDVECERVISEIAAEFGGRLDCVEETDLPGVSSNVTLTYVFSDWDQAEKAESAIRGLGFHTEGCGDYPS